MDAGCGSGAMTHLLAQYVPKGFATGVDTRPEYLAFARRVATEAGINNVEFKEGSIFSLPFEDNSFDLVWCRYVLQWVNEPIQAVAEFKRVTRPGGIVVCCHFDGFGVTHYPADETWQADADKFFNDVIDPFVGRKQYWMFQQLGFTNITIEAEPDRSFSVSGPIDKERRENWEIQLKAALPALIRNLGSEEQANEFVQRFLAYQDREDTFSACILYFVKGSVP